MLFYYLAPLQNDSILMSQCVQFTFGDKWDIDMKGWIRKPARLYERKMN